MFNTQIIETWVAPLIITIIGTIIASIVAFYFKQNKKYKYENIKEKQEYLYKLNISIDNSFQKCIDIYIYDQHQINENLTKLGDLIVNLYTLSNENPPPINIDNDKYDLEKLMQSIRNLNSLLEKTKNGFSNAKKTKAKIELLDKLRNDFLLFCYNNKSS